MLRNDKRGLQVLLISGPGHKKTKEVVRAKLTNCYETLCSLTVHGNLEVTAFSSECDRNCERTIEGSFVDFIWEKTERTLLCADKRRVLALSSSNELYVFEIQVEDGVCDVTTFYTCNENTLRKLVESKNLTLSSSLSLRIMSFENNSFFLLLNNFILINLIFPEKQSDPETCNCFALGLQPQALEQITDGQICRHILFLLDSAGRIYIYDTVDGKQLAEVDLTLCQASIMEESQVFNSRSPLVALKVSHDLENAVVINCVNLAISINLNEYFRTYPEHLLYKKMSSKLPMKGPEGVDEDDLASSAYSNKVQGFSFQADRSWNASLSLLYKKTKMLTTTDFIPEVQAPWYLHLSNFANNNPNSSLGFLKTVSFPQNAASALSRYTQKKGKQTGDVLKNKWKRMIQLQVPKENMNFVRVSVSGFTVLFTLTSTNNHMVTVAFWDLQTQDVIYQVLDTYYVPVECDGEEQLCLLLTDAGLSMVLFGLTQEDLLNRLMIHGCAGTVDSLCHLNHWDRCSISIHSLEAGLENRQLDTVDFFLKSKEDLFSPPTGHALSDQVVSLPSQLHLKNVLELRPALDLLCCAIRENHSETQSKQFSEQLLILTIQFLNKQVRGILVHRHELDEDLQKCVNILTEYITELRTFMKKFPRTQATEIDMPIGPDEGVPETQQYQIWELCKSEEVICNAVLSNQVPAAQAFFRAQRNQVQNLEELTQTGLNLAYDYLIRKGLKKASELLKNMGFNVKEQLHSICFHTPDRDLRDFLVKELQKQNYLSVEEKAIVEFAYQVEKLYSSPLLQTKEVQQPDKCNKMEHLDPKHKCVLEKFLDPHVTEKTEFSGIVLDWVQWWSKADRERIMLCRQSDKALKAYSPEVLWMHLTSQHDWSKVHCWIEAFQPQNKSSEQTEWPPLTEDIVDQYTCCNSYMQNHILDTLARKGIFIPSELADFEQLLLRLSRTCGVMQDSHPVTEYQTSEGLDFHSQFILYCLEHSLGYLLYAYLDHYGINQSNCPLLASKTLHEAHPWLELLMTIREASSHATEPQMVFQASLANTRSLIPSNQASSMLLEGHTLLALATIMYAPGGIDQIVGVNNKTNESLWKVDPQLLKMALTPYPKLRAALFPQHTPHGIPPLDISLYHLLQSLFPFDPFRLFGWQSTNTLACGDILNDLPHFSCPDLVNKYAITELLDFSYYLRHGRPSFAFGTFLIQQLAKSKSSRELIQQAGSEAYSFCLSHFYVPSITAACVTFLELLGVDSLKLRVDLKVASIILTHWIRNAEEAQRVLLRESLAEKIAKLSDAEITTAEELLVYLEVAVWDNIQRQGISRVSLDSSREWSLVPQFCRLHSVPLSTTYLQQCAREDNWLQFLVFIQLHNYPEDKVTTLLKEFSPTLQAHLTLAFENLQLVPHHELERYQENTEYVKTEQQKKKECPTDLFQVLFLCQDKPDPWFYLATEAVKQHFPVLSIFAASLEDASILHCLCVWIITSVEDIIVTEATNHIRDSVEHHEWDLRDLSVLWKVLLKRQNSKILSRGFQLFLKESPILYMLQMYELCTEHKNYNEAKVKLLEFQKCLVQLKTAGVKTPTIIPVAWLESQAVFLLELILQQCRTQYELRKLLQLLADVDNVLKSNGPDFKKLSSLSQLLQETSISINTAILANYSTDILQNECRRILGQLQEKGLFSLARQVAELAELPIDNLVINELIQELEALKEQKQWHRKETRINFWRKCHDSFVSNSISNVAASEFFSAEENTMPSMKRVPCPSLEVQMDHIQEKCFLLTMAGHWLAKSDSFSVEHLEEIEKRIWLCQIAQQTLTKASEALISRFSNPVLSSGEISFESMTQEFSFSKLAALNSTKYLKLEGLPNKATSQCRLDKVEMESFSTLIGQLLDEGCIEEASRACRYFDFYSKDVFVVLHCRALASGEADTQDLHPDMQVILTAEATFDKETRPRRRQLSSSGSTLDSSSTSDSCSSFVLVQHPGEQIVLNLKILSDECLHGKNFCRQILSLYELSKELGCSYMEISSQDSETVLRKVLSSQQLDRYKKAQAFITTQGLKAETVAELLSEDVVQALLSSDEGKATGQKQIFNPSDGKEVFLQLAKLCQDPTLVGIKLLDKISSVPHGELACTVELLILAHDCFSLTCHMEGIVKVLQAARHLTCNHLAPNEQYSLMVRLLTGISRYNDMTYIFDLLHQNHRFEMLLRKKVESNGLLKTALLDYIKRCHPGDSEKHNMVALCFSMCREIGENHEGAARTQLKLIESQSWDESLREVTDLKNSLTKVLTLLKDAAESYSKDSCVRQALRCVKLAKLVTLQLHLLNGNQYVRLINLSRQELMKHIISLPKFYQASVVAEAYDFIPDWAEVLYKHVIIDGDFTYLEEFKQQGPLQTNLFEEISKKFKKYQGDTKARQNLKKLLKYCEDIYIYYKLAYEHEFFDVANLLLQDARTSCYLNDMLSS
nr:PREDICTED: spatacsin isoform X1 [Latimeria chalumnae]|eukprot:XP_005999754.1 PREDICTED: spatacsin isoform X1 [Latimeria chalumnae]